MPLHHYLDLMTSNYSVAVCQIMSITDPGAAFPVSLRLGVPSLPAGEQPGCGDLREKEGFLMVASPSWTSHRKDRCKLTVITSNANGLQNILTQVRESHFFPPNCRKLSFSDY